MDSSFEKRGIESLDENLFKLIGKDWMLITAGTPDKYNTMTASWGQMGILWNLPVSLIYIRPQRFTFGFVESSEFYTLSFFNKKHKDALKFCGSHSGRDYDKEKETGLHVISTDMKNVSFQEAAIVMECRKLYSDNLKENLFFNKKLIEKSYPEKDFHKFYIGEICNLWVKK